MLHVIKLTRDSLAPRLLATCTLGTRPRAKTSPYRTLTFQCESFQLNEFVLQGLEREMLLNLFQLRTRITGDV